MRYTYTSSCLSLKGGRGKLPKVISHHKTRSKHFNVQNLGKCYQTQSTSNDRSLLCSFTRWVFLSALLSTALGMGGIKRKRSRVGGEYQAAPMPAGAAPTSDGVPLPKRGRWEVCTESYERRMKRFRSKAKSRDIAFKNLKWIYTQWMQSEHEFRIYEREFDKRGRRKWRNTRTLTVVELIVPETHNAKFQVVCELVGGLRSRERFTYSLVDPYIDKNMPGVMETPETPSRVFYAMTYTPKLGKPEQDDHQRPRKVNRREHQKALRKICQETLRKYACLPTVEGAPIVSPFTIAPLQWCRARRKPISSTSVSSSALADVTNSAEGKSSQNKALEKRLPPASPPKAPVQKRPPQEKTPEPSKLCVTAYEVYKIQDPSQKQNWYPCIVLGKEAANNEDVNQVIYQPNGFWVRYFPREETENGMKLNFDQQYYNQLSCNTWIEWGCEQAQVVQKLEDFPKCLRCDENMQLAMAAREDGYIDDQHDRDACCCGKDECGTKKATRENHLGMNCGFYYRCKCGFKDPRCVDHTGFEAFKNVLWD